MYRSGKRIAQRGQGSISRSQRNAWGFQVPEGEDTFKARREVGHQRGTTVHNPEDTIIGCNRRMFEKQLACDVKFKVGQSKSPVGAHKYVLSARSDVFFTMFNGSVPQGADVDVPDIEQGPFRTFLRYLYCDEVLINSDNVLSVLYCCKKYNVQSLLTKCVDFVKQTMSVDNVCSLLEQAHFFDEQQLYQSCLSLIHQQGASVLQTDGFHELSRACVLDVISSDSLACQERIVFEAMLRWAEAECKRQSKHVQDSTMRVVLGELVFQIRFGLLDMSFYSTQVSTRQILDDAEKLELFQAISGTPVGVMKFNGKQRKFQQRNFQQRNFQQRNFQQRNFHRRSFDLDPSDVDEDLTEVEHGWMD